MSESVIWRVGFFWGSVAQLAGLGGYLRCEVCGERRDLGDIGAHLTHGWPKHCGLTMRWWTARQVDAGEDR
jgi:hypothetical protein